MLDLRKSATNSALRKMLTRTDYPLDVMLTCVRWYVAYPLSLRHVEEMIAKSAVFLLTTPLCIAGQTVPVVAGVFRSHKRPVASCWRTGETYK